VLIVNLVLCGYQKGDLRKQMIKETKPQHKT